MVYLLACNEIDLSKQKLKCRWKLYLAISRTFDLSWESDKNPVHTYLLQENNKKNYFWKFLLFYLANENIQQKTEQENQKKIWYVIILKFPALDFLGIHNIKEWELQK